MSEKSFREQVAHLIKSLRAPKGQFNQFGKYKYRSCEDILEAVKPHLDGLILTVTDEIIEIRDRIYVKATAKVSDLEKEITVSAFAREPDQMKGMSDSQVTGAASSYARKYALNGLLCIDDSKDADTMDNSKPEQMYVIPFGKFKGKKLTEVSREDLFAYVDYIEKKASEDGKELTGGVLEFVNMVDNFFGKY